MKQRQQDRVDTPEKVLRNELQPWRGKNLGPEANGVAVGTTWSRVLADTALEKRQLGSSMGPGTKISSFCQATTYTFNLCLVRRDDDAVL